MGVGSLTATHRTGELVDDPDVGGKLFKIHKPHTALRYIERLETKELRIHVLKVQIQVQPLRQLRLWILTKKNDGPGGSGYSCI